MSGFQIHRLYDLHSPRPQSCLISARTEICYTCNTPDDPLKILYFGDIDEPLTPKNGTYSVGTAVEQACVVRGLPILRYSPFNQGESYYPFVDARSSEQEWLNPLFTQAFDLFIDRTKPKQKVTLIGHGAGGLFALAIAAARFSHVGSVIMLNAGVQQNLSEETPRSETGLCLRTLDGGLEYPLTMGGGFAPKSVPSHLPFPIHMLHSLGNKIVKQEAALDTAEALRQAENMTLTLRTGPHELSHRAISAYLSEIWGKQRTSHHTPR